MGKVSIKKDTSREGATICHRYHGRGIVPKKFGSNYKSGLHDNTTRIDGLSPAVVGGNCAANYTGETTRYRSSAVGSIALPGNLSPVAMWSDCNCLIFLHVSIHLSLGKFFFVHLLHGEAIMIPPLPNGECYWNHNKNSSSILIHSLNSIYAFFMPMAKRRVSGYFF